MPLPGLGREVVEQVLLGTSLLKEWVSTGHYTGRGESTLTAKGVLRYLRRPSVVHEGWHIFAPKTHGHRSRRSCGVHDGCCSQEGDTMLFLFRSLSTSGNWRAPKTGSRSDRGVGPRYHGFVLISCGGLRFGGHCGESDYDC